MFLLWIITSPPFGGVFGTAGGVGACCESDADGGSGDGFRIVGLSGESRDVSRRGTLLKRIRSEKKRTKGPTISRALAIARTM
jgi:hypothetical protein